MKKKIGKKILIIFIAILLIILSIIFFILPNKKYQLNEIAEANNLEVQLIDANYNNNTKQIEFTFSIKNNNMYSITINNHENFKMYGIKQTEMFSGDLNSKVIKSNDKITYSLAFSSNKLAMYEVIFSSGKDNAIFLISNEDL